MFYILAIYVTGFDKTRLPHASNSLTLTTCKLIACKLMLSVLLTYNFHKCLSLNYAIKGQNLKMIAYSYIELCAFKVTNLDVCGSLVLLNLVTYIISTSTRKNWNFKFDSSIGNHISRHTVVCCAAQEADAPHCEYINRKEVNAISHLCSSVIPYPIETKVATELLAR